MKYCIATFTFGERYYNQVIRMIQSSYKFDSVPPIIVVTDNPSIFEEYSNVHAIDIKEYNEEYSKYSDSYYTFDFSVKRYAIQAALDLGYTDICLVDNDVIFNQTWNYDELHDHFQKNHITSQVAYDYFHEIHSTSMLGRRFDHYCRVLEIDHDRNKLTRMPEDCITLFSFKNKKQGNSFVKMWDKCIEIKKRDNLFNMPAGNIDEICFAALCNNMVVTNRDIRNLLIAIHDKWYA